jgi:hypothetical protein
LAYTFPLIDKYDGGLIGEVVLISGMPESIFSGSDEGSSSGQRFPRHTHRLLTEVEAIRSRRPKLLVPFA